MPTLALATTNPGKVKEFRALIRLYWAGTDLAVVTPADLGVILPPIEENGVTFAENARLKATAVARATGYPALADDSGLCVDALDGAPGLHSARWAGPEAGDAERTAKLLALLTDVTAERRGAHFVCAAALARPDGECAVEEGRCNGSITAAPQGANGFGYDPVFWIPALGRTMAELTDAEKNTLSHRAQALTNLTPHLSQILF